MNSHTQTLIGWGAVAAVVVAGVIASLQGFDAEQIACDQIDEARINLQAQYDTGVSASVQMFAEEKAAIDERLSACLSAKPLDPCKEAQQARDAAVEKYNSIPSPPDTASYEEFNTYFNKREDAYTNYKKAKDTLDQCRAANPPKADVPYEESDTKACFDAYDAAVEAARDTFARDTQTMRAALKAALAALDAREKACNPPSGKEDKFTATLPGNGTVQEGDTVIDIASCRPLSAELDTDLFILRKRAAALPIEIQGVQTSIENIEKRMDPLERNLLDVDTYIPPESTRTQFEGALNALRAERKVALESSLEFYTNLLERRQAEKTALEEELRDIEAQIKARLEQIEQENEARRRNFPTNLHLAKPDECDYYHCHGMLCGQPDPATDGCGQGVTSQDDVECKQFIEAYYKEAGI